MTKYEKVYYDIKDKIKNGIIKPGDFLKKEDDLAKDYNFSKLTVRKALSMLETEGFIQKVKGKKSIVLEKKNLENISLTSIQTVQELNKLQNINLETDLISLYIVQGDKKLMKEFQVSESADFYKVVRTNSLNSEVLNYSTSFFDRKIVPFLNEEIAKKSIYGVNIICIGMETTAGVLLYRKKLSSRTSFSRLCTYCPCSAKMPFTSNEKYLRVNKNECPEK